MPLTISFVNKDKFIENTTLLRTAFTAYLDSLSSTFRVLDSISAATLESEEGDVYVVGSCDDGVAALMMISGGMFKRIDELVARPGNGALMVEFAMDYCRGVATLDSYDAASTGFWGKVGFVKYEELPRQADQGGCRMRLRCATSSLWISNDDKWKIVREAAVALPIGFGKREPQPYSSVGNGSKDFLR